jgi:cytidylate kinase
MIIAIDGPAGSGKSTTAKEVAHRMGFLHLDSGALYRAFALAACQAGWAASDGAVSRERVAEVASRDVGADAGGQEVVALLDGHRLGGEIRTAEVTACASKISAYPEIRSRVNDLLRRLAAEYPGGIVCEGRDMGTVVFPEADIKVFLVAAPEERARRRLLQQGERVTMGGVHDEAARLVGRDTADSERTESPLRKAEDAISLDTTHLAFEEQVERIVEAARRHLDMGETAGLN